MADSQLETADELRKGALKLAGELSDGTSDYDELSDESTGVKDLELMNTIYKALHYGGNELTIEFDEVFDWLKASDPEVLTLQLPHKTGSVTATNGSTTIVLTDAPASALGSLATWFFRVDGRDSVYRIASHAEGSNSLVLDQAYLEETGSALSYELFKLEYKLTAKMARIFSSLRVYRFQTHEDSTGEITKLDERAFDRSFPIFRVKNGIPTHFKVVEHFDDVMTIQFDRYPDTNFDKLRVEVPYIPKPELLVVKEIAETAFSLIDNTITLTNHPFENGQVVRLKSTGTLPSPLALRTNYYIISATADTFKLATTKGGAEIDITLNGSGTHSFISIPRMPVGHRTLLMNYAAYNILADKSDPRSDFYFRVAQSQLQSIVNAVRRNSRQISRNRGRTIPRQDQLKRGFALHRDRFPRAYDSD